MLGISLFKKRPLRVLAVGLQETLEVSLFSPGTDEETKAGSAICLKARVGGGQWESSGWNDQLPPSPLYVSLAAVIRLLPGPFKGKSLVLRRVEKRHKVFNFADELGRGRGCRLSRVPRAEHNGRADRNPCRTNF